MDKSLEQSVRRRARSACEYCQLPESASTLRHVVDHIIARQHGGVTADDNLALCCGRCNLHKGPNIAGLDPGNGQLTRLYNPRVDLWATHFRWQGGTLIGLTPIGRATIEVLAINTPERIALRQTLIRLGRFRTTGA